MCVCACVCVYISMRPCPFSLGSFKQHFVSAAPILTDHFESKQVQVLAIWSPFFRKSQQSFNQNSAYLDIHTFLAGRSRLLKLFLTSVSSYYAKLWSFLCFKYCWPILISGWPDFQFHLIIFNPTALERSNQFLIILQSKIQSYRTCAQIIQRWNQKNHTTTNHQSI